MRKKTKDVLPNGQQFQANTTNAKLDDLKTALRAWDLDKAKQDNLFKAILENKIEDVKSMLNTPLPVDYLELLLDFIALPGDQVRSPAEIGKLLLEAKASPHALTQLTPHPNKLVEIAITCPFIIKQVILDNHSDLLQSFLEQRASPHLFMQIYARAKKCILSRPSSKKEEKEATKSFLKLFKDNSGALRDEPNETLLSYSLFDSRFVEKRNLPLCAWRLFAAGANLWDTIHPYRQYRHMTFLELAIRKTVYEKDPKVFIFLKAVNVLFVSQIRSPIVSSALHVFFPLTLVSIIMNFSDDQQKTPQEVEKEVIKGTLQWESLETDPLFATAKNHPEILALEEKSKINLFIAAKTGKSKEASRLLENTDPTTSISGNTAFIWALQGKTRQHVYIAQEIFLKFCR